LAAADFDRTLAAVEDWAGNHPDVVPAERASLYLSAIKRRWWFVVAGAVATALLSFAFSAEKPKQYEGKAKVLLTNTEPVNVLLHSTGSPSNDPERDLNTEVALVKLDSAAARVRRRLGLRMSTTALLREVSVAPQGTSNVLAISARDRSPTRAAAIANEFAARYLVSRAQLARSAFESAVRLAQMHLAELSPAQRSGQQGAELRAQLRQLETAGALQTGGALIVDPAAVPTTAVSPRPKFAAAVGGFMGLLLGALTAIVVGAADRRRPARARLEVAAATNGHVDGEDAVVSVLPPSSTSVGTGFGRQEEAAPGRQ
jgi:uncharacterized protein involved in exopolysaccharide biosynthesis